MTFHDDLIIYYWSDGTWVTCDEYNEAEYSWKSDDFGVLVVPIESSDEEINYEVAQRVDMN